MSLRYLAAALCALPLAFPGVAPAAQRSGSDHAVLLAAGTGLYSPHGSPAVRVVQRRLALAGYSPGPVDGRYGTRTSAAVVRFQSSHGLQVDGVVGPQTSAALAPSARTLVPGAGDQPGGAVTVRDLQRRLVRAGYSPGPIDGQYGPLTERAVRHFQAAHRLPATGIAARQTVAVLSAPTRSRRVSRPPSGPGAPASSTPHPAPTPAPVGALPAQPNRHSGTATGTVAIALLAILLLAAALIIAALRIVRRRTSPDERPRRASVPHDSGSDNVAPERRDPVATANGHGVATANGNGHGNGSQSVAEPTSAPQAEDDESEAAYRRADQRGDAAATLKLGLLLEERGQLAEAEAAYERADQRGYAAAASNLGVLLDERGDSTEAEAAYRRADQRGDAIAAFNLGVLLEGRGEIDEARAAYARAEQFGHGEVAEVAHAALLALSQSAGTPTSLKP